MEPAHLFLRALDLVGTIVFALSGGVLGARRGLDLFGVLVLSFVTAMAGGITRDLLIGATPPHALRSSLPLLLALGSGLCAFFFYSRFERLKHPVQIFDAAGLGVFAVTGTERALAAGLPWSWAVVLGMVTGIGGGVLRDVLVGQVPTVLRAEIYALAALAGGLAVVAGRHSQMPPTAAALAGVGVCFFLRLMAVYRGWSLPLALQRES